jgi:hypothetical protein
MRNLLRALLLALPLLAVPARADAHGETACSIASCLSHKLFWPCCCDGCGGCGGCGMGCPWYTYWPYGAHFQTPAHPEYPFWPAPMAPVMSGGHSVPTAYGPVGPGYVQPVSFPRYWHGY